MAVDPQVIEKKISGENKEPLTAEEQKHVLEAEEPVEGYDKSIVDIDPNEMDQKPESTADDKDADGKGKEGDEGKPVVSKIEKQEEQPAAEAGDFFVELERELDKPEGQENFKHEDGKSWSDREKAYYHQMRRDRKKRQEAESKADVEARKAIVAEKALEDVKKAKEAPVADPLEDLKKRDKTDYMTVGEVVGLIETITKQKPAADPEKKPTEQVQTQLDPRTLRFMTMCEKESRAEHPDDFDAVMELTNEIVINNPQHLTEIAKAMQAGENPAEKAYKIIKADPEFAKLYPVATAKIAARKSKTKEPEKKETVPQAKSAADAEKERKAEANQKALEKNAQHKKTTGNIDSASDQAGDEPSLEEYMTMPDAEFKKLPKKKRDAILKQLKDI